MILKPYSKYILFGISTLIVGSILYYFRDIVTYVVLAWVVSMIGAPIVKRLRTIKFVNKSMAAGITLGLFAAILGLLVYLVVPPLFSQIRHLSEIDYKVVASSIEQPLADWKSWLEERELITVPVVKDTVDGNKTFQKPYFTEKVVLDSLVNPFDSSIVKNVTLNIKIDASDLLARGEQLATVTEPKKDFFARFKDNLSYYLSPKRIQEVFTGTVSAFGNIMVTIASVLFISFFFLREQGLFYDMVKAAVPNRYEERVHHAIDESSAMLIRYFSGILLQMFIITVFVFVGLSILGLKNALLIGFFAAIMNVIPYIGPILGAAIGVIITISSNLDSDFYLNTFPQLIRLAGTFALMQLLDNFILQPVIFSKSIKAHPLEIFIVVLMGAKIGGPLGMVLAIPAYTVIRVLARVFFSEFKVVQKLTATEESPVEEVV